MKKKSNKILDYYGEEPTIPKIYKRSNGWRFWGVYFVVLILIVVTVLFFVNRCNGQTDIDSIFFSTASKELINEKLAEYYQHKQDSLDSICMERGHILEGIMSVTDAYYPPRYVDLDTVTYRIVWDRNTVTSKCSRCGRLISRPVNLKPDTTIIWRK